MDLIEHIVKETKKVVDGAVYEQFFSSTMMLSL